MQRAPRPVPEDPADAELGVDVHYGVPLGKCRRPAREQHHPRETIRHAVERVTRELSREVCSRDAQEVGMVRVENDPPFVVHSLGARDEQRVRRRRGAHHVDQRPRQRLLPPRHDIRCPGVVHGLPSARRHACHDERGDDAAAWSGRSAGKQLVE